MIGLDNANYAPANLLDTLIDGMALKNDAALARRLEVGPPVISKIRHKKISVGAVLLIAMHEESGLTISELRALMVPPKKAVAEMPIMNCIHGIV